MATTPIPQPSPEHQLIATLATKHASVSYLLIAIIVIVLLLAGVGGYISLKLYDAQLARAEKQEAIYNQNRKDFLTQLQVHDAERDAIVAEQNRVIATMAQRDRQAASQVAAVNQITTEPEAVKALNLAYHFVFDPKSIPQLNLLTVTKIEHDQVQGDLNDETALYNSEKQKTMSLTSDLASCQKTGVEAQKTIDDFKKLAKKSKFKKFLDGALKVSIFVGGVALGRKL